MDHFCNLKSCIIKQSSIRAVQFQAVLNTCIIGCFIKKKRGRYSKYLNNFKVYIPMVSQISDLFELFGELSIFKQIGICKILETIVIRTVGTRTVDATSLPHVAESHFIPFFLNQQQYSIKDLKYLKNKQTHVLKIKSKSQKFHCKNVLLPTRKFGSMSKMCLQF